MAKTPSDTRWVYDEHPAMFANHPFLFSLLAVTIIGFVVIGVWAIVVRTERLAVGERDVLLERGFIAKQRVQVSRASVRAVRVTQGVMQRMLGVGDIEIFTGGDFPEIAIRGLPRPNDVRALLADAVAENEAV
ncbi:PH domain-containing protein [Sphingobium sufflavum]|nr:PH domain-containing protein [Sphingobium sufflavum]MCE7795902.1 PH domain-containing protein [Sphingobium sufflavum]